MRTTLGQCTAFHLAGLPDYLELSIPEVTITKAMNTDTKRLPTTVGSSAGPAKKATNERVGRQTTVSRGAVDTVTRSGTSACTKVGLHFRTVWPPVD